MRYRLPVWKMQSIGNDFPVVHLHDVAALAEILEAGREEELRELPQTPDVAAQRPAELAITSETVLRRLAVAISDRHFGVGGDGLLAVGKTDHGMRLRMFNPDGTEDFCGNGLRCAAVHGHAMEWVGEAFEIEHLGRLVRARLGDGRVRTIIGRADYTPSRVPLRAGTDEMFRRELLSVEGVGIVGSSLTTGSTHTIIPVASLPDDETILRLGPVIEHADLFPERTSVIWTEVVGPDHLRVRIWERGVGETLGCGTGSSAAAVDYLRAEGRGGRVQVDNPGGTVFVTMSAWDGDIEIEGVAEYVFAGEYEFDHAE